MDGWMNEWMKNQRDHTRAWLHEQCFTHNWFNIHYEIQFKQYEYHFILTAIHRNIQVPKSKAIKCSIFSDRTNVREMQSSIKQYVFDL
jgi:hypothetical protein